MSPGGAAGDVNRFDGVVRDAVFQGESVLMTVTLKGGHEIQARLPNCLLTCSAVPAVGSAIQLGIAAADSTLLPDHAA